MSAVVKRALPLLKVLADAKPKLKKAIIQHAPTELVTAISEIVLNLIKGVSSYRPSVKGDFHAARVFGAPRGRRVEITL